MCTTTLLAVKEAMHPGPIGSLDKSRLMCLNFARLKVGKSIDGYQIKVGLTDESRCFMVTSEPSEDNLHDTTDVHSLSEVAVIPWS